jgi:hypothetical protein
MVGSLDAVERECPRQLLEFVECVEAQPHLWQTRCDKQRANLAACSSSIAAVRDTNKVRCKAT